MSGFGKGGVADVRKRNPVGVLRAARFPLGMEGGFSTGQGAVLTAGDCEVTFLKGVEATRALRQGCSALGGTMSGAYANKNNLVEYGGPVAG
ncbi:hypothetical protein APTSU1_000994300 [Apodemus speciosus]|uniref:Uncharacterized protein n=1 Tax=Apodemus speciosus TaxID=105296 RepID=A0ABQ0F6I2_APOSI